jgi:hypothetical protein
MIDTCSIEPPNYRGPRKFGRPGGIIEFRIKASRGEVARQFAVAAVRCLCRRSQKLVFLADKTEPGGNPLGRGRIARRTIGILIITICEPPADSPESDDDRPGVRALIYRICMAQRVNEQA